jgi:hypothetical protein
MSFSTFLLGVVVSLFDGTGAPLPNDWNADGAPVDALLEQGIGFHQACSPDGECFGYYVAASLEPRRILLDWRRPDEAYGVALRRDPPAREVERLPSPWSAAVDGYSLSDHQLPGVVRVARHEDNDCRNPVDRIDEVPLESYVAGVVNAEIGIFAAAGSGEGVQIAPADRGRKVAASFETFAIAARTYVVWWILRRGVDAEFHIHDGPCNQVYSDARSTLATTAAAMTEGLILSPSATDVVIDKHEYASSCARHGTLPSYRDAHSVNPADILPDEGLDLVCVRSWCGHNNERMAHQDNPTLPAGNRCLVRGICQWGSLERSVRGDTFREILAHYQPGLAVIRPGAPAPLPDAGPATNDSGRIIADGGQDGADGGVSGADAGASSRRETSAVNACGCAGGVEGGWLVLLGLLLRQRLASRPRRGMASPP